ncbi:hypothetical protein ACFQX6_32100 [Streptosporangium lutulentum]
MSRFVEELKDAWGLLLGATAAAPRGPSTCTPPPPGSSEWPSG